MTILVEQSFQYQGHDRWRWSVWLDGPADELDRIEYAEYTLHPTFDKPVRRVAERRTKFRLQSSGWGQFMIHITVKYTSGGISNLSHFLWLDYPTEERARTARTRRKGAVLILASVADALFASDLAKHLMEDFGIRVLTTAGSIRPGASWQGAVESLRSQADAIVLVLSDRSPLWVDQELDFDVVGRSYVPLIPIVLGSRVSVPKPLQSVVHVNASGVDDAEAVAAHVIQALEGQALAEIDDIIWEFNRLQVSLQGSIGSKRDVDRALARILNLRRKLDELRNTRLASSATEVLDQIASVTEQRIDSLEAERKELGH